MKRWTLVVLAVAWGTSSVRSAEGGRAGGPGEGPGFRGFANPLVQALDSNGDGALSADEIQNAAAALKSLDKDGDGALKPEEMRPEMRGGERRGPPAGGEAGGRRGEGGARAGGETGGTSFQAGKLAKDDAEKKILDVLDDMHANQRGGNMNVPEVDGRLLRFLAEAIGAKHVVEIGTSNGYSGIWFCLALRTTGGKLTTHDISEERGKLARENFARAGVSDIVTRVMGDAHETVAKLEGPIDLVFVDADKEGYSDYLEKLLPKVRPGGIIVAHNITPRMADARYIRLITENPQLESLFPELPGTGGVSVTLKKR